MKEKNMDGKDVLEKTMEKKKIPKEVSQEILKKILKNLILAIVVMIYFIVAKRQGQGKENPGFFKNRKKSVIDKHLPPCYHVMLLF